MKPTRFYLSAILFLLLPASILPGVQAADVQPPEAAKSLERITVVDAGDRVRIEVDSGHAVVYSMSTSEVPASVTVDLPGLLKGAGLQRMEINKPPLLQMIPSEVSQPKPGVQLAFMLTTSVKPDIRAEGTKLVIDFQKAQPGAEIAGQAQGQSDDASINGQQAGSAAESGVPARAAGQAKVMSKVEVQRGDGETTVLILGDGEFTYDVRALKHDRLVVDLAHVASPLKFQILPVDHPLLKQIRIGHHSDRVRLVFDLPQPVQYTVQPGKTQLAVRLVAGDAGRVDGAPPAMESRSLDQQPGKRRGPEQERVRVAKAGRVPFPERLAQLEDKPELAQMAPEVKESDDQPEPIGERRFAGRRISLDFQQADIQNVFRLIAEVSGFNLVIGESVKAKVTMRLLNVPWDQALDMLLKMNNLGKIRSGNIIWIDTLANVTRQQEEEVKAKEIKAKAEDLITRIIYIRNVQAAEVQASLRQYLSPRGQLSVNQGGNAIVVQDTASRVAAFKELVDLLDVEVPQIQIEARIVQADTSYSRGLGVQWGVQNADIGTRDFRVFGNLTGDFAPLAGTGATTQPRTFMINLPAAVSGLSSVPGVGFSMGKLATGFGLDARLSAGEVLGLTKVIAAPKISTLDKREAKISQGESIPFQTTSLQGTQTTFVDANLELLVTPQITSRDPNELSKQVLMKIKATRNAVGARSNPAGPSIDKREANTQVLVRDGETAVIGGIFVDSQTNNVSGTPYLSRIPVLGWLFKNKSETVAKQELLIFLTPFIVKS